MQKLDKGRRLVLKQRAQGDLGNSLVDQAIRDLKGRMN